MLGWRRMRRGLMSMCERVCGVASVVCAKTPSSIAKLNTMKVPCARCCSAPCVILAPGKGLWSERPCTGAQATDRAQRHTSIFCRYFYQLCGVWTGGGACCPASKKRSITLQAAGPLFKSSLWLHVAGIGNSTRLLCEGEFVNLVCVTVCIFSQPSHLRAAYIFSLA